MRASGQPSACLVVPTDEDEGRGKGISGTQRGLAFSEPRLKKNAGE